MLLSSGDICPVFQIQGGFSHLLHLPHAMDSSDLPEVVHANMASIQSFLLTFSSRDKRMALEFKPEYKENSNELGYRNTEQTGQLNPLFHTFTDLVKRVGKQQNTE